MKDLELELQRISGQLKQEESNRIRLQKDLSLLRKQVASLSASNSDDEETSETEEPEKTVQFAEYDEIVQDEYVGHVVLQGYMKKLSALSNLWKKRFVVLMEGGILFYFDHEEDEIASGMIPLRGARVLRRITYNGKHKKRCFNIRVCHKSFLFKAKDSAQKTLWCDMLEKVIESTNDYPEKPVVPHCGSFDLPRNVDGIVDGKREITSSVACTVNEEDGVEPETVFEGWLEKLSGKEWKRRWFVLKEGGPLYYFDSNTEGTPVAGAIYIESRCDVKVSAKEYGIESPSCFVIVQNNKEFILRALSENDKDMWCKNIELNMNNETYMTRLRSSGSFYEDKKPMFDEQCASIPYTSNTPTNPIPETVY